MSPEPSRRRVTWRLVSKALAIVVLLGMAVLIADTRSVARDNETFLETLDRNAAANRESRIQFQAAVQWQLCSRDPAAVVSADKVDAVRAWCEDYETLAEAEATERAKSPREDPNPDDDGPDE